MGATDQQLAILDAAKKAGSFGIYTNSYLLIDNRGRPIYFRPQPDKPGKMDSKSYQAKLHRYVYFKVSVNMSIFATAKVHMHALLTFFGNIHKSFYTKPNLREAPHYRLNLLEQPRAQRFTLTEEEVFLAELKRSIERYLHIGPDHKLPNSYENLQAIKRGDAIFSTPANTDFNDLHSKVQALETTVLKHTADLYDHSTRIAEIEDKKLSREELAEELSKILPEAIKNKACQDALAGCKVVARLVLLMFYSLNLQLLFLHTLKIHNEIIISCDSLACVCSLKHLYICMSILIQCRAGPTVKTQISHISQTGLGMPGTQDGTDSDATNLSLIHI